MIELNELEGVARWHRSSSRQRKADLRELAKRGENWALVELEQLQQAEREKHREAYQRFKSRRTPETLRMKWRTAKAALRATKAEAEAEAKRREAEELAAKAAAAAAADAERQQEVHPELATGATVRELQVIRAVANPRLILCAYWQDGQECRCLVNVGRNCNFVRGLRFQLQEPSDPVARSRPWPFAPNRLPKRRGRWNAIV
jgi:hypothetical protein